MKFCELIIEQIKLDLTFFMTSRIEYDLNEDSSLKKFIKK